jgi:glutamyl-tRNA synthetase
LPLLDDAAGRRLAKRDKSLELSSLRDAGVSPQSVIGYLAWLMGLIPAPDPCAPSDLIPLFSWDAIVRAGLTDRKTDSSILKSRL